MSELVELAEILGDAGYVISEFYDEYYDKEPAIIRAYQGIILKIIRVKPPKPPAAPPDPS